MNRRAFLRYGSLILAVAQRGFSQVRLGPSQIGPSKGAISAGGGGTWTFIASVQGTGSVGGTQTIVTSSSLTVVSGDLLVAYLGVYASSGGVTSPSVVAGSDTFTASPAGQTTDGNGTGEFFYKLSASGQTTTVTGSWTGANTTLYGITVLQFRPSNTAFQDTYANGTHGSSATPTTGNTVAATSFTGKILALIGVFPDDTDSPTGSTINSLTTTGSAGTYVNVGYYNGAANNATFSGQFTYSGSENYNCDLITFKN